MNNKRKIRDTIRLIGSLLFMWLYIPHFICIIFYGRARRLILSDVIGLKKQININLPTYIAILYLLHNDRYYRKLFYYRIGPVLSLIVSWLRPGDKYFTISYTTKIGKCFMMAHPYASMINAESIGDNFYCIHGITIGKKNGKRPVIGNNVTIYANAIVIGDIHVGNNVIIGASSVVLHNIPSHSIVAGNPAKVIKKLD